MSNNAKITDCVEVVGVDRCWKLPTKRNRDGYARWASKLAHRVMYQLLIGEIPRDMTLDHLCRHRWCVHPNHVTPVPHIVNTLRGRSVFAKNARRQRCPRGHVYSGRNRAGSRICHRCLNAHAKRYQKEKRSCRVS